jgi:hypothetical protein
MSLTKQKLWGKFMRLLREQLDEQYDDDYHYDKMLEEQQYYEQHPESPKNSHIKT